MQYNINIHQLSAIYHNHMDVDLNDIATLSYIKDTTSNPKVLAQFDQEKVWYWISYSWIQKALPLVYKSVTIDTVYRHIKKLEKMGYVVLNKDLSKKTGKTFIRLADKCQTLLFSDAKTLDLSKMDKTSEANLAKYLSIGEKPEPPIGEKTEPNTIIVSNTKKGFNIFSPLENNLEESNLDNTAQASARENLKSESEVDFSEFLIEKPKTSAQTHDFVPEGIESSKRPYVAPEVEKTYKYPPFHPTAPSSIRNEFESYVDAGKQGLFEYIHYQNIAWREIKSDKNERPWDPKQINVDFLNETCAGHLPVKKYIGVKATKLHDTVKKEYHYINLFNYDFLSDSKVGPQFIKPIMETATEYCENYYKLLKELYEQKLNHKNTLERIRLNKGLPEGYEGVEG